jgi:hypothetical protein
VQGGPLEEAGAALLAAAYAGRAEEGAARLIPALRHTPAAASLPPAARDQITRCYRRTTARFLQLEAVLARLIGGLQTAGIEVLLLKGYPLARFFYASPGLRPMTDLDIAVPAKRFPEAADLLAGRLFSGRAEPKIAPTFTQVRRLPWRVRWDGARG